MTLTAPACPGKRLQPPGSAGDGQEEPGLGSGPSAHLQLLRVLGEAPGHEGRRDGIPVRGKEGRHPGGREGGTAFPAEGRRDGIPSGGLASPDTPGPAQPAAAGHCHLATGEKHPGSLGLWSSPVVGAGLGCGTGTGWSGPAPWSSARQGGLLAPSPSPREVLGNVLSRVGRAHRQINISKSHGDALGFCITQISPEKTGSWDDPFLHCCTHRALRSSC
ncbi:PREDICTED: uncharacterized protein LOC108448788 [Corvus brachyrhynchos]|uniref:uncharacterized protein LOC108448788 n=1 Tax=Corvus brachyrhynchos TaxID=85066 RepID=UPI00081654FB|nr:PREDICTED: uncharacterized protein LOC108448788 [Corvus brachyrhynchos]